VSRLQKDRLRAVFLFQWRLCTAATNRRLEATPRRQAGGAGCHKMVTALKPFFRAHETVLKRAAAYRAANKVGIGVMTIIVAFLVCCSLAVFLAHAVDAYHAG